MSLSLEKTVFLSLVSLFLYLSVEARGAGLFDPALRLHNARCCAFANDRYLASLGKLFFQRALGVRTATGALSGGFADWLVVGVVLGKG